MTVIFLFGRVFNADSQHVMQSLDLLTLTASVWLNLYEMDQDYLAFNRRFT